MNGSINSELFDILFLRSSPEYHAAEVMRRQMTAAVMASSPSTTEAYAAIRLLIGTWETIALRVRANDPLKVPFYDTNPVGHMWDALKPAIVIIRGGFGSKAIGRFYAYEFRLLNAAYRRWLRGKPASYQTAALQGINAQFG